MRLGATVLGDDRARLGAVLLAVSPFAAVFSMAYSESLFLALSLGAFLAAERDRRAVAGVLLALAALTRLQGALLLLPLWLVLFVRDGRRLRVSQGWLVLSPLAGAGFLGYVGWLTGSAGAYGAAQAVWGRSGVGSAASGPPISAGLDLNQLALLATLLVSVFLLVFRRLDRIPWSYALVSLVYVGAVLASGILESVGRYVTLAFPNAWILAGRRASWFRLAWPAVSIALLGVASLQMFRGFFVP